MTSRYILLRKASPIFARAVNRFGGYHGIKCVSMVDLAINIEHQVDCEIEVSTEVQLCVRRYYFPWTIVILRKLLRSGNYLRLSPLNSHNWLLKALLRLKRTESVVDTATIDDSIRAQCLFAPLLIRADIVTGHSNCLLGLLAADSLRCAPVINARVAAILAEGIGLPDTPLAIWYLLRWKQQLFPVDGRRGL